MSDNAITVKNLSKSYLVGHNTEQKSQDLHLREVIARSGRDLMRKTRDMFSGRPIVQGDEVEEFWALKDVSFEIKQGDRVGIIGRNGAGKSTLLKILSRITEPTKGRICIHGRVASLLEVGTGFHPELSGRENIFLNGAILGMSRQEIQRKFDEIVDFSEVEKFLDTPVKRYSSGMYVRLAFAVAAHLEPEILIVDEVLAVGDAQFQKKCLGKMEDVSQNGRTVLFVSHNLGAIRQLCTKAIWLEQGRNISDGDVHAVSDHYQASDTKHLSTSGDLSLRSDRQGSMAAVFVFVETRDAAGTRKTVFSIGDDVVVHLCLQVNPSCIGKVIRLSVQLRTTDGINLCNMADCDSNFELTDAREVEFISIQIADIRLYPGSYYLGLWAGSSDVRETYDFVSDCSKIDILDGGKLTTRQLPRSAGLLFLTPNWVRAKE